MKRYKLESGKGASPLYAQIKDILLSNIEEGIYKDKIPTEKQLQELFQVSRITVRQAIDELVSAIHSSWSRYQSMVRTMPFSKGVSGYQPRSFLILVGSMP